LAAPGDDFEYIAPLTTPAGIIRWVKISGKYEKVGSEPLIIGALRDITHERKTQSQLKNSENMYRSLFEMTDDGVSVTDLKGNIIMANQAKANMLGYDNPEELIGKSGIDMIAKDSGINIEELMARAFSIGSVSDLKTRLRRKDGSLFWVEFSAILLHNSKGDPEMFIDIMKDIDEQYRAEKELNIQKAFFENLFENSPLAIVILDNNDRVVDFNIEFENLFGFSKKEALGNQINDLIVPYDLQDEGWQATDDVAGGKQIEFETVRRNKQGQKIDVNVIGKPIIIGDNQLAVYGIYQDISERKQAREELQKIARLESIGIMAGGIAHNFKNLLASMSLNIGLARSLPEKTPELLDKIESAIESATQLATRFQAFSSGGEPVTKPAELSNIIEEAASIALSGTNISYRIENNINNYYAEVDPQQMNEVFSNLLLNANEAMPDGGTVSIRCENTQIDNDSDMQLDAGHYLRIEISDQGRGIPEENIPKIFDPFFSTKVGGHGLGLSAAQMIVRKHRGAITAESEEGSGSTFIIYLPAVPIKRRRRRKTAKSKPSGKGRVLFMDDESEIRESIADMARLLGFDITTASKGEEAINHYHQAMRSGKKFDAAVLDLTVRGGMGGEETIKHLKKIDPEVKAIVFSGHSAKPIIANYRDYGFTAKIDKPVTIDEFAEVLNSVIAGEKN
jgi:PAS domain S-box-containing protein